MNDELQRIYESLSAEKKAEIQEAVLTCALNRERDRDQKIEAIDVRRDSLIQELKDIEWTEADNDKWFQDVKADQSLFSQDEHKARLENAKKLHFRKRTIVETELPSLDVRLRLVLEKLEVEELQEDFNQEKDFERLLEPILQERKIEVARKKYENWHKQKKAEEEAEQNQRHDLQLLVARIREHREQAERRRKQEARLKAIEEIREYVAQREILQLVHFTPRDNLPSILRNGLLSRKSLAGKSFVVTDDYRADGWLDWLSLSVSFPNYKMFFPKRRNMANVNGWVVLAIRPELLWESECKYFVTNAASSEMRALRGQHWSSPRAFKDMFGQENYREEIPPWYTTDPQAEVMVRESIPIQYVKKIIVASDSDSAQLVQEVEFPVEVDGSYFRGRCDHKVWKNYRLTPLRTSPERLSLVR